jgi:hypothetical protein
MERDLEEQPAAAGEGPSPLWLFGSDAAAAGGRAASHALPPEICEEVFTRLGPADRKALHLVNSAGRAYHNARVTALSLGARGLRRALAGTMPGLRALPALRTLTLDGMEFASPRLEAALQRKLPDAVPWLQELRWGGDCPAWIRVACFAAAARLPTLQSLGMEEWLMDESAGFDDDDMEADDYGVIAALLRTPGAFQHLRVRTCKLPAASRVRSNIVLVSCRSPLPPPLPSCPSPLSPSRTPCRSCACPPTAPWSRPSQPRTSLRCGS